MEGDEFHECSKSTGKPKQKHFDFSKFNTRFIALRFAYMGWNYNGLNFQYDPTPLPTVEEAILEAMKKAKLIMDADPAACEFSRCGRTDKGVSALNQVISLRVRSNLASHEQAERACDEKELPYVTILNALLPLDIRITAVCLRPPEGFDARFSCVYRHYKYVFSGENLNIEAMTEAASKFEGENDFRNFCKVDGSKQITNHRRVIHSAKILPLRDNFFVFDLKGSAFLWHQVRCMMAILFLTGQGLEKPSIVSDLMDIEKYPSRPLYDMAHDVPLVLYDCVFPEMEWLSLATDFGPQQSLKFQKECQKLNGYVVDQKIKSQIVSMMSDIFISGNISGLRNTMNLGDGVGRAYKTYVPIKARPLGETVEQQNAKFLEKKKRKIEQ
ncbi:tRNA pseudouridine(38-40) synthase [Candidozyma duobushaemuli]|nr:tRNA pseudouridine(38-40) synthase [[Candida] duobushaemulonis]PVH16491.1 tRNA pseudouridine(38-40) synthase [[Candida] duobushaemulonis]